MLEECKERAGKGGKLVGKENLWFGLLYVQYIAILGWKRKKHQKQDTKGVVWFAS
jgi:hypothetical protein